MRCRALLVVLGTVFVLLLAGAAPAAADVRHGTLAYRHGAERPRIEYRVVWTAVDADTVKTTKVMLRVRNPQRPGSTRNWASVTVFVGGVHPEMGEAPWDGHADWLAIAPGGGSGANDGADPRLREGGSGATVVWSCRLYLGSGVWKTRYVPVDQRRSARYDTWIRVRFHAPGKSQYWFRLTSPLG